MGEEDEAPTPTPAWRDAALIARQLRGTTAEKEQGKQATDRPKKRAPRKRRPGWISKPGISERSVRSVVEGGHPLPDLSRAEAALVALRLRARGFSVPFAAKRLGVSERTVFRLLEDGKKIKQGKTDKQ